MRASGCGLLASLAASRADELAKVDEGNRALVQFTSNAACRSRSEARGPAVRDLNVSRIPWSEHAQVPTWFDVGLHRLQRFAAVMHRTSRGHVGGQTYWSPEVVSTRQRRAGPSERLQQKDDDDSFYDSDDSEHAQAVLATLEPLYACGLALHAPAGPETGEPLSAALYRAVLFRVGRLVLRRFSVFAGLHKPALSRSPRRCITNPHPC